MFDNMMNKKPKHGEPLMNQIGTTAHGDRSSLNPPLEVIETILQDVFGKMAPDAGFDRRAEEFGYAEYDCDDEPYEEDDEPMTLMLRDNGEEFEVQLKVQSYRDGKLAIVLLFWNEDFWDIWTIVTIDLLLVCDQDCAYIDTQTNGKEILDWLEQNKLAVRTRTSFCLNGWSYPMYRFDPDVLKKFDPEGYDKYLDHWKMYNVCDE